LHKKGGIVAASPPDVRYRLEIQAPFLKLDSLHSGFAAGCEARLCLAVQV
jgi:hypothetical protein